MVRLEKYTKEGSLRYSREVDYTDVDSVPFPKSGTARWFDGSGRLTAIHTTEFSDVRFDPPELKPSLFWPELPAGTTVQDNILDLHYPWDGSASRADLLELMQSQTLERTKKQRIQATLQVGDTAPVFEAPALDGSRLRLSDYRGKYVLLDFWATTPYLKKAYERFGDDERFVMIGLSLDRDLAALENYVKENDIRWPQAFLGEWSKAELPDRYGVTGIPNMFLIDPDGKVIGRNMSVGHIMQVLDGPLSKTGATGV
jgi:peroxiredoxin